MPLHNSQIFRVFCYICTYANAVKGAQCGACRSQARQSIQKLSVYVQAEYNIGGKNDGYGTDAVRRHSFGRRIHASLAGEPDPASTANLSGRDAGGRRGAVRLRAVPADIILENG